MRPLHRIEHNVDRAGSMLSALYGASIFVASDRMAFRGNGLPALWALDLRRPLADHRYLLPISRMIARQLQRLQVSQVAGLGVAASLIVAGVVATGTGIRGGIVRESRKAYGFREIVEGALRRDQPVAVLDDILASGRTLRRAVDVLRQEGFQPTIAIPIFRFGWRPYPHALVGGHLKILPLATLHKIERQEKKVRVVWNTDTRAGVVWGS